MLAPTHRTLVKNYLREAIAQAGADVGDQIDWLEAKRVTLSAEVDAGDWAVIEQTMEGHTARSSRGITCVERLAAVIAALDKLEAANGSGDNAGGPAILSVKIYDIQP